MALMERMRGFTKFILYFLVFAFLITIIFEWGMDFTGLRPNTGIVAKINGEELHVDQFWRVYQQELTNYQQQYGIDASEPQQEFIRNQVWEGMLQNVLVQQEINRRGLQASDAEILHYLVNDPPEVIKRDTSFQGANGQFDRAKYNIALRNPQNDPIWKNVEDYLRSALPLRKIQDEFRTTVFVTDSEVRAEFAKREQKASIEYLYIDPARFSGSEGIVTDAELRAEYNKRKDEFVQPERRKIEYVIFSTQATAKDSAAVLSRANTILERARSGANFDNLATIESEDETTSENGGDLGFFKKGAMVKPFEEAAWAAAKGDIVGPVQTTFGVHIIKVTDRKTEDGEEQVQASHILLRFNPSDATKNAAQDSAEFIATTAQELGWEDALAAEGLTPQSSPFFQEGSGFIPGLGIERPISRFVFKNAPGTISEAMQTERGYVVVNVVDSEGERTRTLEEVRATLESEIKKTKRKGLTAEYAAKLRQDLSSGTTMEALAANDSLTLKTTESFTRSGSIAGIGRDPALIGAAFALEPGEISQPVDGLRGFYIVKLLEKSAFDETAFAARKEALRSELMRRKEQQVFTAWYAELKKTADIEDFRKDFF